MTCAQVEESLVDETRIALLFSSQGMPLSVGREALDAVETKYDLIMPSVADKDKFLDAVRAHCVCFRVPLCCRRTPPFPSLHVLLFRI